MAEMGSEYPLMQIMKDYSKFTQMPVDLHDMRNYLNDIRICFIALSASTVCKNSKISTCSIFLQVRVLCPPATPPFFNLYRLELKLIVRGFREKEGGGSGREGGRYRTTS